eukprot:403374283
MENFDKDSQLVEKSINPLTSPVLNDHVLEAKDQNQENMVTEDSETQQDVKPKAKSGPSRRKLFQSAKTMIVQEQLGSQEETKITDNDKQKQQDQLNNDDQNGQDVLKHSQTLMINIATKDKRRGFRRSNANEDIEKILQLIQDKEQN